MSSLVDILSKVELLIHFGTTLVKHAKEIKEAVSNAFDDAEEFPSEEPDFESRRNCEEGDEDQAQEAPSKKRKSDC